MQGRYESGIEIEALAWQPGQKSCAHGNNGAGEIKNAYDQQDLDNIELCFANADALERIFIQQIDAARQNNDPQKNAGHRDNQNHGGGHGHGQMADYGARSRP